MGLRDYALRIRLAGRAVPLPHHQHGFVYIRQLAIHLRTAVAARSKDSFRSVYNWQFLNSLRLWAAVLCAHAPADAQLRALVYPLTQVGRFAGVVSCSCELINVRQRGLTKEEV